MSLKPSGEKDLAYHQYVYSADKKLLVNVCYIVLVSSLAYIVIDYFRTPYFTAVVLGRSIPILIIIAVLLYLRNFECRIGLIYFFQSGLFSMICIFYFFLDFFAHLPPFFLPNALVLFCFVAFGLLGYNLGQKYIQSACIVTLYSIYALTLSHHKTSHLSQIFHLVTNVVCAVIVGYLIDKYKRKSFIQNQILEESNIIKARLLNILSHDLMSPLNSLKGLLSLRDNKLLSDTDSNEYFSKVGGSLNETTDILQNLMRWSKTQLGGFVPSFEKVRVASVVEEVAASLNSQIEYKDLSLQIIFDTDSIVNVDKEMLRLALRNVLTNAIKFSRVGSTINISGLDNKTSYAVSISDEGVGMSNEQLEKVFSMKSISTNGTLNEKGSGIGLTIVKEFTERFGGSVSVNSELQKGSTFTFDLPKE